MTAQSPRATIAPRESAAPPGRATPRRTIATRILASFAVTVLAFAVTVGWSVVAQRQTAHAGEEIERGYLPAALKLGRLRATQGTVTALVENGAPDERNAPSMRQVLTTMRGVRKALVADVREGIAGLRESGGADAESLARALDADLAGVEAAIAPDGDAFDELFAAIDAADAPAVGRALDRLGALEHEGDRRLHAMSDRLTSSMNALTSATAQRERRALFALVALAALTLGVGVGVSLHTRRLLAPLARVRERAQAVAHGDLTAREVVPTGDEIGDLAVAFERMVGAVARAQDRAVSNERLAAIGKMAAHVTHEIRNPLSSIGLNIELLDEELAEANVRGESRALLGAITREVVRLEHLSEEYLRVARLPEPRMEADDVAAAVREIVRFATPELERASCAVHLDLAEALPPALFDESQLRQALLNLLRNAREAMPDGGTIDVRAVAEGMSVVVSVDDRGVGIPDEIRARVFDPFFSTKGEGTGLGLAITRQIVEAHGGALSCAARDGGGTSFRIALPIAPTRLSGAPSAPPARPSRAAV